MIEPRGSRLAVTVPLVMANARGLLEAGRLHLKSGNADFDLGDVREADSSAVAVMLGLLRTAELGGLQVRFVNVPPGVLSLAELYGVADLIQSV